MRVQTLEDKFEYDGRIRIEYIKEIPNQVKLFEIICNKLFYCTWRFREMAFYKDGNLEKFESYLKTKNAKSLKLMWQFNSADVSSTKSPNLKSTISSLSKYFLVSDYIYTTNREKFEWCDDFIDQFAEVVNPFIQSKIHDKSKSHEKVEIIKDVFENDIFEMFSNDLKSTLICRNLKLQCSFTTAQTDDSKKINGSMVECRFVHTSGDKTLIPIPFRSIEMRFKNNTNEFNFKLNRLGNTLIRSRLGDLKFEELCFKYINLIELYDKG